MNLTIITTITDGLESDTSKISTCCECTKSGNEQIFKYNLEDGSENIIRLSDSGMQILRSGEVSSKIVFSPDRNTKALYDYGGNVLIFDIGMHKYQVHRDLGVIDIEYDLMHKGKLINNYKVKIIIE